MINVGSGIASQMVLVIVGIILLPYAMWRLGITAYGVYELAASIIVFLQFLQLGMSPTIIRFCNQSIATNDYDLLRKISSTAQLVLGVLGLVGMFGVVALTPFFLGFYGISKELHSQTIGLLCCMSLAFLVRMLLIVPNGLILGNNRYDLTNGVEIAANVLRLALVVGVFETFGPSVFVFGLCILSTQLFRLVACFFLAIRLNGSSVLFSTRHVDFNTLRSITGFSLLMFVNSVALYMVMQLPILIIGKTLGVEYVALLAPAKLLASTLSGVLVKICTPLVSVASQLKAKNRFEDFGRWTISIAAMVSLIGLGLALPFCTYGDRILQLWVGAEVAAIWVMVAIFVLGAVVAQTAGVIHYMALGSADMRPAVYSQIAVGCIASIGVTVGTIYCEWGLLYSVCFLLGCRVLRNLLVLTLAYSKHLNYDVLQFLRLVYMRPFIALLFACAVAWGGRKIWQSDSVFATGFGLTITLAVYVCLAIMLMPPTIKKRLHQFWSLKFNST